MPAVTYEAELALLPVPFRVDHRHEFDNGLVEVRRYFWSKPIEQTMNAMSDALVINMALTSRPPHTRVDRIASETDPLAGEAGRLLIMIPGVPYHLTAPSGSFRSLHCAINCAKFEEIAGEAIDWAALGPFGGEARAGLGIETHLTRIHDELVRNRIGREGVIEACVEMISIDLCRQFRQGRPSRPDVHIGGLAAWRMRTVLSRIHSEGPAPRVIELAELCALTERQLSRAFKAETGMTLGRFVDEVTMERAHRLLTTTRLSMADIASELGFASADSFAQSYRRLTGAPPSRIRQR
jgi:AraC family transcriptional regulator